MCSSGASSPDLVVRMETLGEDVREVTRRIGLEGEGEGEGAKMPSQFPHTHRQEGGHSSEEELASRWVVSKVFQIVVVVATVLVAVAAICSELLLLLPLSQKSFDIFVIFLKIILFLLARYFSQLSKSTVLRLYDKYRLDHELFGYDPQPFVDMAKEDEEERHF